LALERAVGETPGPRIEGWPEVDGRAGGRWRAPDRAPAGRADLRIEPRAWRAQPRGQISGRRSIAASRLRFGRCNQGDHLRAEQLLERALGKRAEARIEHDHHHAEEQ